MLCCRGPCCVIASVVCLLFSTHNISCASGTVDNRCYRLSRRRPRDHVIVLRYYFTGNSFNVRVSSMWDSYDVIICRLCLQRWQSIIRANRCVLCLPVLCVPTGNLIIDNVQREDEGTYVCRADNQAGQRAAHVTSVEVLGKWLFAVTYSTQLKRSSCDRGEK